MYSLQNNVQVPFDTLPPQPPTMTRARALIYIYAKVQNNSRLPLFSFFLFFFSSKCDLTIARDLHKILCRASLGSHHQRNRFSRREGRSARYTYNIRKYQQFFCFEHRARRISTFCVTHSRCPRISRVKNYE